MSRQIPVENFIRKMKVHSRQRIKIPSELCDKWVLKDGDFIVFWYAPDGGVLIKKVGPLPRYKTT